ncbi:MAG: hypothetical protein LAO06_19425 [Acidobacteriia bacterium]|nr:hypothetical protein [Terriglobia bacterium]
MLLLLLISPDLLRFDFLDPLSYAIFKVVLFACFCFAMFRLLRHEFLMTFRDSRSKPKRSPRTESG